MRKALHDLWGCAHGPISRLAPSTRIVAGAAAFATCVVAPAATKPGTALVATVTILWLIACGTPGRVVRTVLFFGLAVLLPYFLLVPLIQTDATATRHLSGPLAVPFAVVLHGLSCSLISVATITTLTASDLREGLARLPVPGIVSAILLQIVHQAATLAYETRRVAIAMSVRGAASGGVAALRLLSSLPRVWLPRVILRAERVATAMELRGYCDADLRNLGCVEVRLADRLALALAFVALGLAIAARCWWLA